MDTVSMRIGGRKDTLTNDESALVSEEVDSIEEDGGGTGGGVAVHTVAVNLTLSCFQDGALEEGQR